MKEEAQWSPQIPRNGRNATMRISAVVTTVLRDSRKHSPASYVTSHVSLHCVNLSVCNWPHPSTNPPLRYAILSVADSLDYVPLSCLVLSFNLRHSSSAPLTHTHTHFNSKDVGREKIWRICSCEEEGNLDDIQRLFSEVIWKHPVCGIDVLKEL